MVTPAAASLRAISPQMAPEAPVIHATFQGYFAPATVRSSICERVAHEDGVLALRAGREQRHRRPDQLLKPPHIFDALGGKLGPGACPARRLCPAFHRLVDRLDARLR